MVIDSLFIYYHMSSASILLPSRNFVFLSNDALSFNCSAWHAQKEALLLPKNKLESFLQAFDELQKEPKINSALEEADDKKDAVDGRKLKQLLVAKGVFSDVGEAHSFIQQMVLSQQLEEVCFETYKRTRDSKNA